MKLLVIGLMVIGSLFIGASIQAHEDEDLRDQYLRARDTATEAVDAARNEKEKQRAQENVDEFTSALQGQEPGGGVPGNVWVIGVECNGNCGNNTLGQLCSNLAGAGFTPFAVDCTAVESDNPGVQCGGTGNSRCSARAVQASDPLSWYCLDVNGWDAHVYCSQ